VTDTGIGAEDKIDSYLTALIKLLMKRPENLVVQVWD
jgi:hypothetical protein